MYLEYSTPLAILVGAEGRAEIKSGGCPGARDAAPEARVLSLYTLTRENKRHKHAVPPRTRRAERPLAECSFVAAACWPAT
eukprot:scaffold92958_cov66-Phaeocystis_antarctica.AAC.1